MNTWLKGNLKSSLTGDISRDLDCTLDFAC
jgi:hypothetical protein